MDRKARQWLIAAVLVALIVVIAAWWWKAQEAHQRYAFSALSWDGSDTLTLTTAGGFDPAIEGKQVKVTAFAPQTATPAGAQLVSALLGGGGYPFVAQGVTSQTLFAGSFPQGLPLTPVSVPGTGVLTVYG